MVTLSYTRLPEGKSIRLLRLLASSDDSDQIECELFDSCLDVEKVESFEALSYCWGDGTITKEILVDGYQFHATVNLALALSSLRRNHAPRILWIDAICINQQDINEQSAQVAMMWDIYASASSVVVWLGPLDRDSAVAMKNFNDGAAQAKLLAREKWDRKGKKCSCHGGDGLTHPDRVGVLKLIMREWFTRVWVLQEVAAAKRVVVACGNMVVDGEQFYKEITSVSFFYPSMGKMLRKIQPALELMNRSEQTSLSNKKLSIVELIESFKTWKATKSIDKVYALLGMSSDASTAPELPPDYTISLQQLAQRLIMFAFPSASVEHEHEPTTPGEVTFEVEGFLLGKLGSKSSGGGARAWSIDSGKPDLPDAVFNQRVLELSGPDNRWMIPINNERKLRNGVVVLLRGATRPSVLRFEEGCYTADMLATPEPISDFPWFKTVNQTKKWADSLQILSADTSDMMRFKISWDPFRAPNPDEVSRFTPSPTNFRTQWEAMMETIKDAAEMGDEKQGSHDCGTMTMLWMMYHQDKENLKNGTSKHSITIHKAAHFGYVGTLKLLLDSGADVNAIQPDFQVTALHIAVTQGHTKIVDELLHAGAVVDTLDPDGNPALDIAIHERHTDIVKLLLSFGASPNPVNPSVNTYLIFPSIFSLTDILTALLDAGADPNATDDLPNMLSITPLHMAAEVGHTDVVKALLDAGANVNAKTSEGTTPLLQSAMNGHVEVVKLLLERGADVNAKQKNGTTPWDIAVYKGQSEVARVLEGAGGMRNVIFKEEKTRAVDRKRRFLCF